MRFESFEKIGVSTDWLAVLLGVGVGLLVKIGAISNIPW
jgi:hypothetical protein